MENKKAKDSIITFRTQNDKKCSLLLINPPLISCPSHDKFIQLIRRQTVNRWYNPNTLHKEYRIKILFGIIQKTNEMLELSIDTFCLCIHIFDCVISKYPIKKDQMFPLALVSMHIASKIHEKQTKIISYEDFDKYIFSFGVENFNEMEKMILGILEFRINIIYPNQLLNFLMVEFFKDKYSFFGNFENNKENRSKFQEKCQQISLTTLVDYEFYRYTSLAIAISILVLTRKFFNLELWPNKMKEFTKININNVKECLLMLSSKIENDFVYRMFKQIDDQEKNTINLKIIKKNSQNSNMLLQNSINYFMDPKNSCDQYSLADTADFSAN